MMTRPPVDALRDRLLGTNASVEHLEALWTLPPLPSADDLAVVAGAFPASRTVGQDWAWEDATATVRPVYYGKLFVQAGHESHHAFRATREGRTFTVSTTLGTVEVACHDQARRERATAATADRREREAELLAALVVQEGEEGARAIVDATFGRSITEWSRKSRARMVKVFAGLDYSVMDDIEGDAAMVTLTYPGDWLKVAPTGDVAKRHLVAFFKRWGRDVGPWVGLWKQEFQSPRKHGDSAGQRAPHFHLYCKVPVRVKGLPFTTWLSQTWAKVVGASKYTGEYQRHLLAGTGVDFGQSSRMSDHKRLAIYFLGHSAKTGDGKEYQHIVPTAWAGAGDGPGRFWGYRGLSKATVVLELDQTDWITARRVLRGVQRGNARRVAFERAKHAALKAGRPAHEAVVAGTQATPRTARTLGHGGSLTGGWVLVNDGVSLALDLGRYLASRR